MRTLRSRLVDRTRRNIQKQNSREYHYCSLPQSQQGDYIRTLTLQPGAGDEPLRCTLKTSVLGSTAFESISYVWGPDVRDHEIICEGRVIPITANLWTALRHVRSDVPRVLWADSVCINQGDLEEKSQQVALMGQIYRFATRVLIFLGADDFGHGTYVHSLLEEMRDIITNGLEVAGTTAGAFPWPDDDAPILTDVRWESFDYMLAQHWFDRGWVVQEIAVAQCGCLLWGQYQLDWQLLMDTSLWLLHRAQIVLDTVTSGIAIHESLYQHYHPNLARAFRRNHVAYSFLAILYKARSLTFSDPRDRIFAFAAIAEELERYVPMQPDYHVSFLHIYKEFAITYIRSTEDTELLDYVCHGEATLQDDTPSWVPRWDNYERKLGPRRSPAWLPFEPRLPTKCEPMIVDDSILKVRGVIFDDVVWTSETLTLANTTLETISSIWKAVALSRAVSPYPAGKLIDAFLCGLTRCQYEGQWSRWARDRAACAVHLLGNVSHMEEDNLEQWKTRGAGGDIEKFVNFVARSARNGNIVLTRRGYTGLAPRITRREDIWAIVFGSTTSCILRKASEGPRYQFLGSAMLVGKESSGEYYQKTTGFTQMGDEDSKDWVDWDVEEQDIELC
ncbi:HET-domain-containing protein [Ophiobolus disseminans]|uniref:HET-domain-containing protein n=1 Tax=Ophiobolus disseminans TaxID=1469910 RepID=A0A6A7A5X5_9PLEO|nr:HET-domain-containing protein [Ophiobolus disseminans]